MLYALRQGQSFGESVLTGRRRASTVRANTACEMYTISAEDLQDLFSRRPREGRLMHASLLREHMYITTYIITTMVSQGGDHTTPSHSHLLCIPSITNVLHMTYVRRMVPLYVSI